MREGQLKFIIKMRDEASARLKLVSRELRETSKSAATAGTSTQAAGRGIASAGTAAGIAAPKMQGLSRAMGNARGMAFGLSAAMSTVGLSISAGLATQTIVEFGNRISAVRAATQATDDQFQLLRDKAILLGETTRYSASEAASALEFLAKAGFSVQQSLDAAQDTLFLAASGELELAEATELMTNVMSSYSVAASDAAQASDLLAFTAAASSTSVRELGEGIKYAGASATAFGVDLNETLTAMGALADRGIKASMAGTGLRGILVKLNTPSKTLTALLDKTGLSASDVSTRIHGLVGVLKTLKDAGAEKYTAELFDLFGDRAGPAMLNLLSNMQKIDSLMLQQSQSTRQAGRALDYFASTGERLGPRGRMTETLRELSVMTEETAARLTRAGGDISKFDQRDGLVGALQSLAEADPARIFAEFGETTGRVLVKLTQDMGASAAAIGAYEKDLEGFNARMAIIMENNLGGALGRVSSSFESIFIRLEQDQNGALRSLAENVAMVFQFLAAGEPAIQGIRDAAETLGWSADATEERVRSLAKAIQFLGGVLAAVAAFAAMQVAVAAVGAAIAIILNPITLLAAGIALLTGFLVANQNEMINTATGTTTWGDLTVATYNRIKMRAGQVWKFLQEQFAKLNNWLGISGDDWFAFGDSILNAMKGAVNGYIAYSMIMVDSLKFVFNLLLRMASDFGTELKDMLIKPFEAMGQAASGNFQQAGASLMKSSFNVVNIGAGAGDELNTYLQTAGSRLTTDFVGQTMALIAGEIDAIQASSVELTRQRSNEMVEVARDAVLRARDAVKDITARGALQAAEGDTVSLAITEPLIKEAETQAYIAMREHQRAITAVGEGNVQLASAASRAAVAAAARAEATLSGRDLPTPADPEPEYETPTGGLSAEAIAAQQAAEQFDKTLRQTLATINARAAALTQDADAQRLWNAVTGLGLDLNTEYAANSKEAAALVQIETALKKEGVDLDAAKLRNLGLETEYIRAQIGLRSLTGQALAEEMAVLAERLRLAQENNLATLAEADAYMKAEGAVRALAAANYDLNNASMTVTEGARAGWEEWSKKVADVGGSIKDVVGSSLTQLGSTMTQFLLGQEANWASFANSVISMIMEIIVQLLIMQGIKMALNAMGIPFAAGGVPGSTSGAGANHANPTPFAKGSAFVNSVVSNPTFFKFARGGSPKIGVMGEAGPEAIMPLKRMGNGNLGVEVSGGSSGGGGTVFAPQLTINYQGGAGGSREDTKVMADILNRTLEAKFAEFEMRQRRGRRPGMVGG